MDEVSGADRPWWATFFDRTYTEVWSAAGAFDRTAEEVEALAGLLGPAPRRVLDVPCGWGRHSAALHARGYEVTGVDASAAQLEVAAERSPGPTYAQGDMREPPPGPFDAVLNLYSSFGYLGEEGDAAALRAWHDVLAPGGLLVVEGNHRDALARVWQAGAEIPLGATGAVDAGDVDWVAGVARRVLRLADGSQRTFAPRVHSATELVALVRAAGFADVEVRGGYDGGPLTPATRLLLTARRPAGPRR